MYAEGWLDLLDKKKDKVSYAWGSAWGGGGIYQLINKTTCERRHLFMAEARYNYSDNIRSNKENGLLYMDESLYGYSMSTRINNDGKETGSLDVTHFDGNFHRKYSCYFRPRSEVQAQERRFAELDKVEYEKAKSLHRPRNKPELCDHNGEDMYACARTNNQKMRDYYSELILITAIKKIEKDNEEEFIKEKKDIRNKIYNDCINSQGADINFREGKWVANVCIYTELLDASNAILDKYWSD